MRKYLLLALLCAGTALADTPPIRLIKNANVSPSAAIDATKLGAGTVNNTELGYLDNVTSAIQTQLNTKQAMVSGVDDTEIGYLNGVTSAIQTQLDAKEPTIVTLPVVKGGTNSGVALNNNRVMRSTAGAIVEAAAITASRALASDSNGIPVAAATTATELGYVNGVTSAIQTQIDTKIADGGTPVDNTVVRWDGTTGLAVQPSSVVIDDSNNVSGLVNLDLSGVLKVDSVTVYDNSGSEQGFIGPRPAAAVLGAGTRNWSFGYNALQNLVNGNNNTAGGWKAGAGCVDCSSSSFFGWSAGHGAVNAGAVSAFGVESCYSMGSNDSSCFGRSAGYNATGPRLSAFGRNSAVNLTSGTDVTSAGYNSCGTLDTGSGTSCFGADTFAGAAVSNALVLGRGAGSTVSNTAVAGSETYPLSTWTLGEGETTTTPSTLLIQASGASGTNVAGGDFAIGAGRPTGSGIGGSLLFQTSAQSTSGSTLRSLSTSLSIDQRGQMAAARTLSAPGSFTGLTLSPTITTLATLSRALRDHAAITTAPSYTSIDIDPTVSTNSTDFKGVHVHPTTTGDGSGFGYGLDIDMTGVTNYGTNQNILALHAIGDVDITGTLHTTKTQAIADNGGDPKSLHELLGSTTGTGSVTNGDIIALVPQMAYTGAAASTVTSGPLHVGATSLGMITTFDMAAGSSLDYANGSMVIMGLNSGSGTIGSTTAYRAVAADLNGTTATFTKFFGFKNEAIAGLTPTVTEGWGSYMAVPAYHNWFAGPVKLGGVAGASDRAAAGIQLDVVGRVSVHPSIDVDAGAYYGVLHGPVFDGQTSSAVGLKDSPTFVDLTGSYTSVEAQYTVSQLKNDVGFLTWVPTINATLDGTQRVRGINIVGLGSATDLDSVHGYIFDWPLGDPTGTGDVWGVYVAPNFAQNYFAGYVKIGAGSDKAAVGFDLDVAGAAKIEGGVAMANNAATLYLEATATGTSHVAVVGPVALSADFTMTLPAATDTFVGKATVDTLTNKTFDAAGTGNSIINIPEAALAAQTAGLNVMRVALGLFDPSANAGERTIGSHAIAAMTLPAKAILISICVDPLTTFTSATSAAAIAYGFETPSGDFGVHGLTDLVAGVAKCLRPNEVIKSTVARTLNVAVIDEALTAGKMWIYAEYLQGF